MQRVVVRRAGAVELHDGADVGVLSVESPGRIRAELIDVQHGAQLASFTAHVTDLEHCRTTQALLDLQVVVKEVGCAEILVDRVRVVSIRAVGLWYAACRVGVEIQAGAKRNSGENGGAACLDGVPVVSVQAQVGDRGRTHGIVLQAIRCRDRRAEVQERVHVDLIVEHANSAAHHQIAIGFRLVRESEPGRKVVPVGREDGVDAVTLDQHASSGNKDSEVLVVAVQRSEIFVAQTKVHVQLAGDLYRVLAKEVECVDPDEALWISHRNRGCRTSPARKSARAVVFVSQPTVSGFAPQNALQGPWVHRI